MSYSIFRIQKRSVATAVGLAAILVSAVSVVPAASATEGQDLRGVKSWWSPSGYWCIIQVCINTPDSDCCNVGP